VSGGRIRIHGVMEREGDRWNIWCPELDIMTCGDHADHAAAMLEDAIMCVVPEMLAAFTFDRDGFRWPKRVTHPRRLGADASGVELFQTFTDYDSDRGPWKHQAIVELKSLDRDVPAPVAVVSGDLWWNCRSGVVSAGVDVRDWAFVPARRFKGLAVRRDEQVVRGDIPSCLIGDDSTLRRAGMSVTGIAEGYLTETLYKNQELYQWSIQEVGDVE
jgi:hypothetical protein